MLSRVRTIAQFWYRKWLWSQTWHSLVEQNINFRELRYFGIV